METIYKNNEIKVQKDSNFKDELIITLIPENWSFSINKITLLDELMKEFNIYNLDFSTEFFNILVWDKYHERHLELLQECAHE
jgi:hypothetical protein